MKTPKSFNFQTKYMSVSEFLKLTIDFEAFLRGTEMQPETERVLQADC